MKDKFEITIRIAELSPMSLQINRDEEETIRQAEYNVNQLWKKWNKRFSDKTSHEVLGMVAFQFAKLYELLSRQAEHTDEMLSDFEEEIDRMLLDTDGIGNSGDATLF